MSSNRTRNYASIVYPESAPADWMEILDAEHVAAFVSPLHDKDVNPGGELKKAHYHVMIMFEGVKTLKQAQELFAKIGAVSYVEAVASIRGMARYLCHLDNPEKVRYDMDAVRSFAGADYFETISLETDTFLVLAEIMDFCEENDIFSFFELAMYAKNNKYDWFRIITTKCTVFIKEFLKSRRWHKKQELEGL